jgi:hypothetical protein
MKKKKISKHKNKSKSPKKDNEKDIPKQIGTYHDFLVYGKDDINKDNKDNKSEFLNFDFEDPALKEWLSHQNKQHKTQSRFSSLFKEIMDNDRKMSQEGQKSAENKDISDNKNNINDNNNKNDNNDNNEDKKKEDDNKIEDKNNDSNLIFEINNNIIKDKENKNENNNIIFIDKDNNSNNNNIDNSNNVNEDIIKNNIINIISDNNENNENNNENNNNNEKNNNEKNNNENNNNNYNRINNRYNSEVLPNSNFYFNGNFFAEGKIPEFSYSYSFQNQNFPLINQSALNQNPINQSSIAQNSINKSGYELKQSIYSNSSNLYFTSTNDSDFYSFSNRNSIFDSRPSEKKFELNVDIKKVICLEDRRTTVMIKNIPNKFNRDMLLNIIDKNFKGAYDIFILPTDVNRYKNFGYSFINFTCSYYIPNFYYLFNGKKWSNTNSQKMCEITYSKIQGRNNLLQHYSNKIIFRNDEAKKYNNEKYIIPNEYKGIFTKAFPNQYIEEHEYHFTTKMPFKY